MLDGKSHRRPGWEGAPEGGGRGGGRDHARRPPCLGSSRHRRVCSGRCPTRVCAAGGGSRASPALPAWRRACPATCSSPAPAPSPPARCPPAASTSTPTRLAVAPAPSLPPPAASQRRNVSLGTRGLAGASPQGREAGGQVCGSPRGQRLEGIGVRVR